MIVSITIIISIILTITIIIIVIIIMIIIMISGFPIRGGYAKKGFAPNTSELCFICYKHIVMY